MRHSKFIRKLKKVYNFLYIVLFGNKRYNKFVIISGPRTGSNLLRSLLSSHPKVLNYGEKFKYVKSGQSLKIWNYIFKRKSPFISWVGFKLMYYHPENMDDKKVWQLIKNDNDIVIFHLIRKNYLESFVSLKIGYKTNAWVKTEDNANAKPVRINIHVKELEDYFERLDAYIKETFTNYQNHKIIKIYYEDLIANKEKTMLKTFNELGVAYQPTNTDLKKQNPESLRKKVINYDMVKMHFSNTKWHKFFIE